jgi:urease alpha subunit
MITINPAKQLGIGNRVGSIEEGKEGDIAIFNAHPLSVYAIPQMTIVDGVTYFDIKNDAADMRLDVNPEEAEPSFMMEDAHDHDRCMQDMGEFFEMGHKH